MAGAPTTILASRRRRRQDRVWPARAAVGRSLLARAPGGHTIFFVSHLDPRRIAPRIRLDGLCGVVSRDALLPASMCDLSAIGLRLERPFDPATASAVVQLEIELPGIDEVVWARAEVAHAFLSP